MNGTLPDQEDIQEKLGEYQRLARLDREIKKPLGFSPKKFISFMPPGVILPALWPGREASVVGIPAKSLRPFGWRPFQQIKEEGIQAVFTEPQFNPRPAELWRKKPATGCTFLIPSAVRLEGRDSYLKLMRYN